MTYNSGGLGFLFCLLSLFKASSSTSSTSTCPASIPNTARSDYKAYGDSCYYFSPPRQQSLNIVDAQKKCERGGGQLASILSQEENEFVYKELTRVHPSPMGTASRLAWIGLKYDKAFGFAWDDGMPVSYKNLPKEKEKNMKDRTVCGMLGGLSSVWKISECLYVNTLPPLGFPRLPYVCKF